MYITGQRIGADPGFWKEGSPTDLGDRKSPVGSRGKSPVGGLGTKSPEAGDLLKIIPQCCAVEESKTVLSGHLSIIDGGIIQRRRRG